MLSRTIPKLLDLAVLQALAAEGGYSGTFTLSDESALVALSSALWLENLDIWQGEDYELTTEEIDEIQELTANLQYELMTHLTGGGSMIKIADIAVVEDIDAMILYNFDSGTFRSYRLHIQGMKSNSVADWVDHVVVTINEEVTAADYYSYCEFHYPGGPYQLERIGNYAGIPMLYAAPTSTVSGQSIGDAIIDFPDPQGDDYKRCSFRSTVFGFSTGKIIYSVGNGVIETTDEIISVEIKPENGTLFKVDPASSDYPSELRMTMYGLE